jgi:hypothetical protein
MNFSLGKLARLDNVQMGTLVFIVFVLGYFIYDALFNVPVDLTQQQNFGPAVTAPVRETDEQRFKRENKNVPMPDGSAIPQDIVNSKTILRTEVPFGDKLMAYAVRLPTDWVQSSFARYGLPGEENYTILTNIARYFGPAIEDARPFFWLETQKITRFITAEAFARGYLIKAGIVPESLRTVSDRESQAMYIDTRDSRSYVIRTIFRMEGSYIVMASIGVPIGSYDVFKDLMGLTMSSFRLITPVPGEIEKINDYKLLNVLKFKYYNSWLPKNELALSAIKPSVELHNPIINKIKRKEIKSKNVDLQGMIIVNAWRMSNKLNATMPMIELQDRLKMLGMVLQVDKPIEPSIFLPIRDNYNSIVQTKYLARVKQYVRQDEFDIVRSEESKTEQEVWITVFDNGYYLSFLTRITPLRDINYIIWAQNVAAYDLAIKSIVTRGAPKTEDYY